MKRALKRIVRSLIAPLLKLALGGERLKRRAVSPDSLPQIYVDVVAAAKAADRHYSKAGVTELRQTEDELPFVAQSGDVSQMGR